MSKVPKIFTHMYFGGVLSFEGVKCLWLPKISMAKVINQKEENVWPLIISSQCSPGEEKEEEKASTEHVSVFHSIQDNDLRQT